MAAKRKLEDDGDVVIEDVEDDDDSPVIASNSSYKSSSNGKGDSRSRACPYLDTINRGFLDFDFEKLCSVSLSKINVYACLVCGKYFQGLSMWLVGTICNAFSTNPQVAASELMPTFTLFLVGTTFI